MAETFWISFSIGEGGNESQRYQAVLAAVRQMTDSIWWAESTNFILFHSDHSIDEVAAHVAAAFDPNRDLALLARESEREARAIGAVEDALLYELMPYAQRYQPPAPVEPVPTAD